MDRLKGRAVEMPAYGRGGKPKAGFPPRPQDLGNRCAIPTFPPPRLGVEKWKPKAGFPLSHLLPLLLKTKTQKGGLAAVASLPPSGSFFNEKMLCARARRAKIFVDNYKM